MLGFDCKLLHKRREVRILTRSFGEGRMPWVLSEFQELAVVFGTVIISLGIMVVLGQWWQK